LAARLSSDWCAKIVRYHSNPNAWSTTMASREHRESLHFGGMAQALAPSHPQRGPHHTSVPGTHGRQPTSRQTADCQAKISLMHSPVFNCSIYLVVDAICPVLDIFAGICWSQSCGRGVGLPISISKPHRHKGAMQFGRCPSPRAAYRRAIRVTGAPVDHQEG
jgi:hypothetical protein